MALCIVCALWSVYAFGGESVDTSVRIGAREAQDAALWLLASG